MTHGSVAPSGDPAATRHVVADESRAPEDWDDRAVRVSGGHVMQSAAWAAYRRSVGHEPRFLTFDDGRVALATLRATRRPAWHPGHRAPRTRPPGRDG